MINEDGDCDDCAGTGGEIIYNPENGEWEVAGDCPTCGGSGIEPDPEEEFLS